MQGRRGVTHYSTDRATYAVSNETTQFDDELMRRGIVNRTQVLMAKGATEVQARALEQQHQQASQQEAITYSIDDTGEDASKEDDDGSSASSCYDHLLNDDEIALQYQQERIAQFQQQQQATASKARFIQRHHWKQFVNDVPGYVVVGLTTPSSSALVEACHQLAAFSTSLSVVLIDANEALGPQWLHGAALFLYKDGSMAQQFLQLPARVTVEELRQYLQAHGVILES